MKNKCEFCCGGGGRSLTTFVNICGTNNNQKTECQICEHADIGISYITKRMSWP